MLSESQIQCPQCGYLKALHYRELNSLATFIDCPKCGLRKQCKLPRVDEDLSKVLFESAKRRLFRRAGVLFLRRFILPFVYISLVSGYYHDEKLAVILIGMFLMLQVPNPVTHNQLTYVLRLLQYRNMMDSDLDGVLTYDLAGNDLVHDYALSQGACGEDEVKRLDNRYYAYVHWLAASLRSLGYDEETVSKEAHKYRMSLENTVKKRAGGSPVSKQE